MGTVRVGTSGWVYGHWKGRFYPEELAQSRWLQHFAQHFSTVELNASFYHLPKPETFARWRVSTPEGFLFAVKASRYMTHTKKLRDAEEPCSRFINSASRLEEKLGPVLFQLPPTLQANTQVLKDFCMVLPPSYLYAIEPRHESWFQREVYRILEKHNIALCMADSPDWPMEETITAAFIYIRFHGGSVLYGSNYSGEELSVWAGRIRKWAKENLDVYAYFNNDAHGYAIQNAKTLEELLQK